MLYRILVPSLKPDDVSMTIDVEADNWMLALRVGLEEIGADRDLVKRAICEINEDNSIHVIEPKENRVFVLREITAAEADRPIVTPKARQAPPERAATPVLVGAAVGSATEPVFATPEPATAARKVTTEIPVWAMDVAGSAGSAPLRLQPDPSDRIRAVTPPVHVLRERIEALTPRVPGSETPTVPIPGPVTSEVLTSAPALASLEFPLHEADLERATTPAPSAGGPKRTISHLDLNALHKAQVKRPREVGREPSRELAPDLRASLKAVEPPTDDILAGVFEMMQDIDFAGDTVESSLRFAVDVALKFVPSEAAWLLLSDLNRSDLYFAVTVGPKAEEVKQYRLPLGKGIAGFCVVHGVSLSLSDVERDPRFKSEISRSVGYALNSVVCVPVEHDGLVFGALQLMNHTQRAEYTVAELDALAYVAKRTAEYLSAFVGQY